MMDSQSVIRVVLLYSDWIEMVERVPREDYSQHGLDDNRVQHPCLPCAAWPRPRFSTLKSSFALPLE